MSSAIIVPKNARIDGAKVRFYLYQKNLSQKDLAKELDISEPQLCQILKARYFASTRIVAGMAAVLQVSIEEILLSEDHHAS